MSQKLDVSKCQKSHYMCFGKHSQNDDLIFNWIEKLGVPERISSFLDPEKKKIEFNAVIKSHFSFCPLIWVVENLSKI